MVGMLDARCSMLSMLSMDPILNDPPNEHVGPLYRLHRGSSSVN